MASKVRLDILLMATGRRLIFSGRRWNASCYPDELSTEIKSASGRMMFVGDKGKILAGFNVQNPQIISGKKWRLGNSKAEANNQVQQTSPALPKFVEAVKNANNIRQFYGG